MSEYRPIVVDDIKASLLYETKEERVYCIGSISKDKYVKLPEDILEYVMIFVQYLDGTNTIEQIHSKLLEKDKIDLDVKYLLDEFEKADLIINNQNPDRIEKGEFDKFFYKIIDIPLGKYCAYITNHLNRKIVNVAFVLSMLAMLISIVTMAFRYRQFIVFGNYVIGGSIGASVSVALPILLISIALHECSHALAAAYYGLTPSNFVFGFYANLSSMFYLKIPGLYTLAKKEKLVVWSAGVYTNMILAAISVLVSCIGHGTIVTIANLCAVINLSFVMCNLSPLLPLDGYYLLSTIINQPNLRKNSFGMLKGIIMGKGTIKVKLLYIVYVVCSLGFMGAIVFSQLKYFVTWLVNQYYSYASFMEFIVNSKWIACIGFIITMRIVFHFASKIYNKKNAIKMAGGNGV